MHERVLKYLVCPSCAAPLELDSTADEEDQGDRESTHGVLQCSGGDYRYPIVRGIPRLLPHAWETFCSELRPRASSSLPGSQT